MSDTPDKNKPNAVAEPGPPAKPAPPVDADAALAAFEAAQEYKAKASSNAAKGGGGPSFGAEFRNGFFRLRGAPTIVGQLLMVILCLGMVLALWLAVTRGAAEQRIVPPTAIGSPEEVFGSFHSLWFDRALTRNLLTSLGRVIQGFGLAVLIGVPLGILSGAFYSVEAFFLPISVFGRNIPVAALVPLALMWFGTGETAKIGFLFLACVAFVMFDATRALRDVSKDYMDTAETLGASRFQVLTKVLIPLALPDIFNSIRLLFGLAFGYIILVEAIDMDSGVGVLIMQSQRRGPREHVYLVLFVITIVAYLLDRLLFALQKSLFSYRYGRSS